jgi:hypothetical protein
LSSDVSRQKKIATIYVQILTNLRQILWDGGSTYVIRPWWHIVSYNMHLYCRCWFFYVVHGQTLLSWTMTKIYIKYIEKQTGVCVYVEIINYYVYFSRNITSIGRNYSQSLKVRTKLSRPLSLMSTCVWENNLLNRIYCK